MKKIAVILAALMVMGAVPGWCLTPMVDGFVDTHTKNSSFQPVQDMGKIYGAVNHEVGTTMDKVPVIQSRSTLISPVEKLVSSSVDASKSLINGVWEIVTFKSLRDKK